MGRAASGAASALLPLLEDEDSTVRFKTAWALGQIDEPLAVGDLIEALNDKSSQVKSAAHKSLKKLTGEDFGRSYDKWKEWHDRNQ